MHNEFTAVFERDDDWIIAYCPEIPGANRGFAGGAPRRGTGDGSSYVKLSTLLLHLAAWMCAQT